MTAPIKKPTVELKLLVWDRTFDMVLDKLMTATKQADNALVRVDLVATAATVAATLMTGADLEG